MSVPEKARVTGADPASGYGPHAQLLKMLLPSSGCLAIYAVDGDLAWCSDGFERPDFRELVEAVRGEGDRLPPNQGALRRTSAGANALAARLCAGDGATLGYVLIELGSAHGAGSSMATSLTRPFVACLASRLALERPPPVPATPAQAAIDPRLEFLLGLSEVDLNSPNAVRYLLDRCVSDLDCVSAVFCVPDQGLTVVAEKSTLADSEDRARLDATRKHLLAWAQLNNRPMVVNRIENAKAPYKILSCPVVGREGAASGIIALFRSLGAANFELDDVRMIEFVSRQAMALLHERRDALTGLMSRSAFERYLDERLRSSKAPAGMLLYVDIRSLKSINEALGLEVGDEAIVRTSQLLRRALTPGESACRLAGDRFAMHLVERDRGGVLALGKEIARSAETLGYTVKGQRVPLALTFGIAEPPTATRRARHWLAAAELACQQAQSAASPPAYNASRSG